MSAPVVEYPKPVGRPGLPPGPAPSASVPRKPAPVGEYGPWRPKPPEPEDKVIPIGQVPWIEEV